MLREIVLDTETTGLDPQKGDRLIEVGCIEIVNRIPTGREFHRFVNPERDVPAEAEAVHGLSTAFLADKPKFVEIADEFLDFLATDQLVIHNAGFDMGFLNAELTRIGRPPLPMGRAFDTLQLARRKHPAGPNSLDALCKRYGIDISKRTKHGALLDATLLAEVYIELLGVRQAALGFGPVAAEPLPAATAGNGSPAARAAVRPVPLAPRLTPEDEEAHRRFVETLGPKALWRRWLSPDDAADSRDGGR